MEFQYLAFTLLFILQANADDVTEQTDTNRHRGDIQQHQYYPDNDFNYASSFLYSLPPSYIKPNHDVKVTQQLDIQRQLPLNFASNDTNHDSLNYDNQGSIKPQSVVKYSEEQLNLPNPYLSNSNVPKNDEKIPCLPFYPCKINNAIVVEEQMNYPKIGSKVESTVNKELSVSNTLQPPYPTQELYSEQHKQENAQENSVYYGEPITNLYQSEAEYNKFPNDGNSEVTIICYGFDCSDQVKSLEIGQPITIKTDNNGVSTQTSSDYTPGFIKSVESQILKAIINDLQYFKSLTSQKSATTLEDCQPKIIVPSKNMENIAYKLNSSNVQIV